MKNLFLSVLTFCAFALSANASNAIGADVSSWQFFSVAVTPDKVALEEVPADDFLSKESIYAMRQLKSLTYRMEQVVPGDPAKRTVIEKGDIYKALCSIEKGLKKDVKAHLLDAGESSRRFDRALKVGMAAFYADDSSSFEQALRQNRKDYQKQLEIFEQVSLK